jgi:methionyl-tRNA formyltransferase
MIRLVILTTETYHHAYFIKEILTSMPLAGVIIETEGVQATFETSHPFENVRDNFERETFFSGTDTHIFEIIENALSVPNINTTAAIEASKEMEADVFITFGTRKLSSSFIEQCGAPILNLHGGNPERYRGLDSHLWSIYHGDFSGLVTTIHRVNPTLDDGEIILQSSLKLSKGMPLHELRALNTRACIDLSLGALDIYKRTGDFISRPQLITGRYYSFMPSCLKAICVQKFSSYTESRL